jgi:transcriptional regulator with XRE-family HTH domain
VRDRPIDKHIGGRLHAIRQSRGMSLEALASSVGVGVVQLAAYEAGERIKPELLYAIARSLHVLIAEFFAVTEVPERPKDELADFPLFETARLLGAWRQLDEVAQRKALHVVQLVAGE